MKTNTATLALGLFLACSGSIRMSLAQTSSRDQDAGVGRTHVAPSDTAPGRVWRAERACGLNSIYFLLCSLGKSPSYDDLQSRLVQERLTSLQDLKQVSVQYGVNLKVVKMTPDELREVPKPVIAHFEISNTRGETGGHFVVVSAADQYRVRYVDGTTAELLNLEWNDFNKVWSGYAAYPKIAFSLYISLAISVAAGTGAGLAFRALHISLRKTRPPTST